jgi:peptidoglycan/LPS O-acetylase OafA/YrhL
MKERRYDIDWLRVIAMLAVFVYHCTRFFGTESWHLKNPEQSMVVFVLARGLIWPWVMELFFVLSGVGAFYSLRSRSGGRFLWDRVKRLLVPLYTVGLFVLIPPQAYFEAVTNGGYAGSFWEFLPLYYGRILPDFFSIWPWVLDDPAQLVPYGFTGHLWFLQYLFLISLLTLPVLLLLKSQRGQRWIDMLADWTDRRGGIFLWVIPLALILICFRAFFSGGRTWVDLIWYSIFYVFGYMMAADTRFAKSIKRHGWLCLALWLVGFFGVLAFIALVLGYDPMPGAEPFSSLYVVYQIAWSITSWSAVIFMLSLGAKYLNFTNKTLAYANEAVLPFYLLHQTVILCVGWFVIPLSLGIPLGFLIIAVVSFVLIMAIYELLIRRWNIVRFFFGMRPRRKPATVPAAKPEGTGT